MKKIVLLKLGGSLITDKSKPFTLYTKNIERVATEIGEALKEDDRLSLIIGTGTGSFGHYPVKQYGLEKGIKTDAHKYGFCVVHHSVSKLNGVVVEELLKSKIKAFSLHPSSMMAAKNGIVSQFNYESIIHLLEMNMVPVLHGDMLYDEILGSTICSVEMIFSELVKRIHALKKYQCVIIYAGLTDGVLDADKKTVSVITNNTINSVSRHFFETHGYDVTGGMKSKVSMCLQMTKYGAENLIINGTANGNIKKVLLGKEVKGTKIIGEGSEVARRRLRS